MNQGGMHMTRMEIGNLDSNKLNFIETKALHFSDYASLSPSCKEIQEMELQAAVKCGDESCQALVYSGIRAIEIAINEYLEKYALSAKISQAVNVFKKIVDNLHLAEKTRKELVRDSQKREETIQQLDIVVATIGTDEEAKKMVDKFRADIESRLEKLSNSFMEFEKTVKEIFDKVEKEMVDKDEADVVGAKNIVEKIYEGIMRCYSILAEALESLLNKELLVLATNCLERCKKYVEGLMADKQGYVFDSALNLVQLSIPHNANELLSKFEKTKQKPLWVEKDGILAKVARFLGDFFGTYWGCRVLPMKEIFKNNILPFKADFIKAIESGKQNARTNSDGLLEYFEKQFATLNAEIQKRASEQKDLLSEKGELEALIKENKDKMDWLEEFRKELDAVLEI
jgi:hypothetical protein